MQTSHFLLADDDDDDDDDDDLAEDANVWNLRKCSAAGLDTVSNIYHDEILPIVLPIVRQVMVTCSLVNALVLTILYKQMLIDPNWRLREAGILAIGAISEGCRLGMQPHLPDLFTFLFEAVSDQRCHPVSLIPSSCLQCLKDTKPLVRSITCWTLGRYTSWVVHMQEPDKYLVPLMEALLQALSETCLISNSKFSCGSVCWPQTRKCKMLHVLLLPPLRRKHWEN